MTTTDLLKDLSNITNKDNPDKIRKLFLSTRAKIIRQIQQASAISKKGVEEL